MRLKEIPNNEKPRERLVRYGSENLSNEELISIIIKSGNRKYSLKDISYNLLSEIKEIKYLKNKNINSLIKINGVSKIKAIEILAAIELGRRVYDDIPLDSVIECTNPINIINYFNHLFKDKKQEEFYVLYLDNQKQYLDSKLLFKGSLNNAVVHPREIFKEAYLLSANSIICLHNHPSGDCTPSKEDIRVTKKIQEIGLIHSIFLIDHIIIGNNNYYSFFENNKL